MQVPDVLAFTAGAWLLRRQIVDHARGLDGEFAGQAQWAPCPEQPGVWRYREEGRLAFGGRSAPASRELLWTPAADGAAAVSFADGRAFYLLDLRSGRWHAEHRCGADRYAVQWQVAGPDLMVERWQVSGPRKRYDLETVLTRRETGPERAS